MVESQLNNRAFLLILTFSSLAGAAVFKGSVLDSDARGQLYNFWREITVFTFAVPIFIYAMLKISLVIRWCLYWIVVATGLLFLLNLFEKKEGQNDDIEGWVFIGFLIIECRS